MRLGILTGGGDCAGLNAAIRAVVCTADYRFGAEVVGYQRGWNGVTDGDSIALNPEVVRGILPRGGTMLGTSRSRPELIAAGADPLIAQLNSDGVEALVAIGGDGTLMATNMLHEAGFPVVDRLHTSAASHDRVMVLEVMGRHAGHLAAGAGIAGGAAEVHRSWSSLRGQHRALGRWLTLTREWTSGGGRGSAVSPRQPIGS